VPSADTLRDMPSLWQFGGLTPLNLVKLAAHKFSKDELGTRAASLSYYFVLALFPLMLFLVSLLGVFAPPGSPLQERIMTELSRLAPGSASDLVRNIVHQTLKSSSGIKLAAGILGALWSASGGMGAVTTSLNKIYETDETRPWWKQKLTIVGLTIALSGLIILAIVLALYGERIGAALFAHVGAGGVFRTLWTVLEWPVSFAAMLLTFSLVYYFGPDLKERHWYWVTHPLACRVHWIQALFTLLQQL